jgi:large subunit ribosomal protein L17
MRHRIALKKLNADTQHRVAMRRNLARSLILHGRVITTTAKAKAFRPFVERLVTRARHAWTVKDSDRPGYVHALRVLRRDIPDREALKILVQKIAPLCIDRQGGYTRILRDAKNQLGDNAPRAIWEFVDRPKVEATEGGEAEAAKAGDDKVPAAKSGRAGAGSAKAGSAKAGSAKKGTKAAPATKDDAD